MVGKGIAGKQDIHSLERDLNAGPASQKHGTGSWPLDYNDQWL